MKTRRALALENKKLNVKYQGIQTQVEPNITQQIEQEARKTVKLATKVKDSKTFEQKYKTIDSVGTNKIKTTKTTKK